MSTEKETVKELSKLVKQVRRVFGDGKITILDEGIYIDKYGYEGEHATYFIPIKEISAINADTAYHCLPGNIYGIARYEFEIRVPIGKLDEHKCINDSYFPDQLWSDENRKDAEECINRMLERAGMQTREELDIINAIIEMNECAEYEKLPDTFDFDLSKISSKYSYEVFFGMCKNEKIKSEMIKFIVMHSYRFVDYGHTSVLKAPEERPYMWNKILEKLTEVILFPTEDSVKEFLDKESKNYISSLKPSHIIHAWALWWIDKSKDKEGT